MKQSSKHTEYAACDKCGHTDMFMGLADGKTVVGRKCTMPMCQGGKLQKVSYQNFLNSLDG